MKHEVGETVRVLRIPGLTLRTRGHTASITAIMPDGYGARVIERHATGFGVYEPLSEWRFGWEDVAPLRASKPYQRVDAGPSWGVPAPGDKHG